MIEGLDHVAIGVSNLDERIAFFTEKLGMVEGRRGTHGASGGRIAFVKDPVTGLKLELVETPDRQLGLMQIAFRVDDVHAEHERLSGSGLRPHRGPFRLDAAKALTSTLLDETGLDIQIIRYDWDSPDL